MKSSKILILIIYSTFLSYSLYSEELKRYPIYPEIDTSLVKYVFDRGEFIDVYTKISGFRFDKNFNLISKFLQVDTLAKQKSFINTVDYINDKIFVGTFSSGLIVLDTNLTFINQYLSENSKILYSKSCGTVFDPVVKKYFSKNCGYGLFVVDELGNEEYVFKDKPFNSEFIENFNLIDDLYYVCLRRFDFDKEEFYYSIEVFDRDFNLVRTYDLVKNYNLKNNAISSFKDYGKEIGFINYSGEMILVDKNNGNHRLLRKDGDGKNIDWLQGSKLIDDKIYFFGKYGLYNFDMQTEEVHNIPFSNDLDIQEYKIIYDIEKIEERYFVASGRGLLIIDNQTNIENNTFLNEVKIINGILTLPKDNILISVFNNIGKKVYESNNVYKVDISNIISLSGIY